MGDYRGPPPVNPGSKIKQTITIPHIQRGKWNKTNNLLPLAICLQSEMKNGYTTKRNFNSSDNFFPITFRHGSKVTLPTCKSQSYHTLNLNTNQIYTSITCKSYPLLSYFKVCVSTGMKLFYCILRCAWAQRW